MTPQEFKAWFEGFTEATEERPTETQWKRIKERVAEIDGKPVTEHHWYTHYYPLYPHYHYYPYFGACYGTTIPYHGTTTICGGAGGFFSQGQNATATTQASQYFQTANAMNASNEFSSLTAMNALGRAEAATLTS